MAQEIDCIDSDKSLDSTPAAALQKVCSEYEYWSGKLTDISLQMCYALIGANWVILGTLNWNPEQRVGKVVHGAWHLLSPSNRQHWGHHALDQGLIHDGKWRTFDP